MLFYTVEYVLDNFGQKQLKNILQVDLVKYHLTAENLWGKILFYYTVCYLISILAIVLCNPNNTSVDSLLHILLSPCHRQRTFPPLLSMWTHTLQLALLEGCGAASKKVNSTKNLLITYWLLKKPCNQLGPSRTWNTFVWTLIFFVEPRIHTSASRRTQ